MQPHSQVEICCSNLLRNKLQYISDNDPNSPYGSVSLVVQCAAPSKTFIDSELTEAKFDGMLSDATFASTPPQ
eukprot:SAG31_NODE_16014_length_727_cov_1.146497_1_plen_72_part_10